MRISEQCTRFSAVFYNSPTSGVVYVNQNAREARTVGIIDIPVSRGVKRVTRGSKKFKAVIERHRQILREKNH
jgi:hypothetical protein